nr:hypothetical protein [Microtetraspora malaysiensis]
MSADRAGPRGASPSMPVAEVGPLVRERHAPLVGGERAQDPGGDHAPAVPSPDAGHGRAELRVGRERAVA